MTTAMKNFHEVAFCDRDQTCVEELKDAMRLLRNIDQANKATNGELIGDYYDVPYDLLYLHGIRKVFLKVFGKAKPTPEELEKALNANAEEDARNEDGGSHRESRQTW